MLTGRLSALELPEAACHTLIVNASDNNSGRLFMTLKPRGERPTMDKVVEDLRRKTRAIPGVSVFINPIQNLRLGGRLSKSRYQYVMRSVRAEELRAASDGLMARMR